MSSFASPASRSTTLPEDPDIPALALAAEEGLYSVLARVGIRTPVTRARIAKYRPGQRCTLLVDGTGRDPVVVKCYSHDPTPEAALLEVLRSKGLASGRPPTAGPFVACEPELSVLVTGFLPGPSAWDLVRNGAGERAGILAAAWLRRALEARLEVGEHHGVDYVLGHARSRARMIRRVDPGLGGAAEDLADALAASPPAETADAFLHGSFYAYHVLNSGDGPGIIDWDRFRRGPVEVDVAMFLATLSRLATLKSELAPHTQAAAWALTAGMSEFIDARSLAWHQAAALLTIAKRVVRARHQRWRDSAAALLTEAGELAGVRGSRRSVPGPALGRRTSTAGVAARSGIWEHRARRAAARTLGVPAHALVLEPLSIRPGREVYDCVGPSAAAVAKCYPDFRRAAAAREALELFSGTHGVLVVPRCLGFDAELLVVMQERVSGRRYGPRLAVDGRRSAARRAGLAVAQLHAIDIRLPRRCGREAVVTAARSAAARLETDARALAREALARAETALERTPKLASVPAHCDLGWAQMIDTGAGLAIVDFDKAAEAEPALDLGTLVAQLVRARGRAGLELRCLIVEEYERKAGRRVGPLVEPYALLTLVRKLDWVPAERRAPLLAALDALVGQDG